MARFILNGTGGIPFGFTLRFPSSNTTKKNVFMSPCLKKKIHTYLLLLFAVLTGGEVCAWGRAVLNVCILGEGQTRRSIPDMENKFFCA